MTWLDVVIVIVLLGFVVSAYSAGLIREVITLCAVFFGIIIASVLYRDFAKDVKIFVSDEDAARAVAFLVLFGAVYLFGQIAAYVLKFGASLFMLGWLDHLGGAAFGLVKGIFVVQLLLIVFAAYPSFHLDGAIDDSSLGHFFVDDIGFLRHILPGEFRDRIDQFLSPPAP